MIDCDIPCRIQRGRSGRKSRDEARVTRSRIGGDRAATVDRAEGNRLRIEHDIAVAIDIAIGRVPADHTIGSGYRNRIGRLQQVEQYVRSADQRNGICNDHPHGNRSAVKIDRVRRGEVAPANRAARSHGDEIAAGRRVEPDITACSDVEIATLGFERTEADIARRGQVDRPGNRNRTATVDVASCRFPGQAAADRPAVERRIGTAKSEIARRIRIADLRKAGRHHAGDGRGAGAADNCVAARRIDDNALAGRTCRYDIDRTGIDGRQRSPGEITARQGTADIDIEQSVAACTGDVRITTDLQRHPRTERLRVKETGNQVPADIIGDIAAGIGIACGRIPCCRNSDRGRGCRQIADHGIGCRCYVDPEILARQVAGIEVARSRFEDYETSTGCHIAKVERAALNVYLCSRYDVATGNRIATDIDQAACIDRCEVHRAACIDPQVGEGSGSREHSGRNCVNRRQRQGQSACNQVTRRDAAS